ncbi:MAG: hypothetical protein IH872_06030 [Chloroflexi bacterium]|nr:hypothetical protein [Chloroflexota bacterium]
MFSFKQIAVFLIIVVLAGGLLIVARAASVEAGGKGNHIETEFIMIENPTDPPNLGASGVGKLDFNTKKGEFNLKLDVQGLVPGTNYRVTQTVIHSKLASGVQVFILDQEVTADSEGRISFMTKHVPLDILSVGAVGTGPNWRIDQQVRASGSDRSLLVCRPTTKINVVGDRLFEGWVP